MTNKQYLTRKERQLLRARDSSPTEKAGAVVQKAEDTHWQVRSRMSSGLFGGKKRAKREGMRGSRPRLDSRREEECRP